MKNELESFLGRTLDEYLRLKGVGLPEGFEYDLVVAKDSSHGD